MLLEKMLLENLGPAPNWGHSGIEFCFFMPRTINDCYNHEQVAFDLFLLVKGENNLALRFEPADEVGYSHSYAHVQLCRKVGKGSSEFIPKGVPNWVPDSYPAFPLPSSEPLKLFLSMATALHGRSGGIDKVLREIFQKAGRPSKASAYLQVLDEMLDNSSVRTEGG